MKIHTQEKPGLCKYFCQRLETNEKLKSLRVRLCTALEHESCSLMQIHSRNVQESAIKHSCRDSQTSDQE